MMVEIALGKQENYCIVHLRKYENNCVVYFSLNFVSFFTCIVQSLYGFFFEYVFNFYLLTVGQNLNF